MDVAYYLSELLGQLGEVNVPGLGYFVQIRIEGYYNADDSTFYPQKNKVQFDPQIIDDDDDTLAQYIADKKNISLASSRYFTSKYISNLKQEAILKDVPLADLGFLYIEGPNVTFKAADVMKNDPAVFGYAPVQLSKIDKLSFIHQLETYSQVTKPAEPEQVPEQLQLPAPGPAYELPPATALSYGPVAQEADQYYAPPEPVYTPQPEPYVPPVYEPHRQEPVNYQPGPDLYIPPVRPEEQEEFVFHGKTYVPPERRGYGWVWITLLSIIIMAVVVMFAIYKYRPALFKQLSGVVPAPVAVKAPLHHDSLNVTPALKNDTIKDTTKKDNSVKVDTTATKSTGVTVIDTFAVKRYEVLGGSFPTLKEANNSIKNYKTLGLNARIVKDAQGPYIKLTLGTFFTNKEAKKARQDILNTGQVSAKRLSIQPYLPTKNIIQ
jgi:hypothetical protein